MLDLYLAYPVLTWAGGKFQLGEAEGHLLKWGSEVVAGCCEAAAFISLYSASFHFVEFFGCLGIQMTSTLDIISHTNS